ncbi:MAG: hypothetical protein K2X42_00650, partial [Burkholderiaceae bacterium]|nr:hypothetical protein [Burkholderiaceae bacterium]
MTAALLLAAAPLSVALADARDAASWEVRIDEPRPYGHSVGDIVRRQVVVDIAPGYSLDEATLPVVGRHGVPIELRRLTHHQGRAGGGQRLEMTLEYQVLISPREVRTFELPPIVLGFKGGPRPQDVRIDAWPLTVSPLVPVEVSPRRGLGDLQPDAAPPLIDTGAGPWRLAGYGVLAMPGLAYLALVYLGLPWFGRRRRPFNIAWRALKALPRQPSAEPMSPQQRRVAFQRLHEALNQTAGEVVFEHSIERFVAGQPHFVGLRGDLALFFQRSRAEFFGGPPDAVSSQDCIAWLIEFCRKCRDAERG